MESLSKFFGGLEDVAVDLVARAGPWLSPLPTAYLTARATLVHLEWPLAVAVAAGLVIEFLGLAATSTALTLRAYNQGKRKSDPRAPFALAVVLTGVYFFSVVSLTVLLDTVPGLSAFAPLAFPILSLAGVATLALRGDHRQRLTAIAQDKEERRKRYQERRAKRQTTKLDTKLDTLTAARRAKRGERLDALVTFYAENPTAGVTEAGEAVGVSRQSIYNYLATLESAGRIDRSNGSVEVLMIDAK